MLAEVSEGKFGGCSTFVGTEMSVEIDGVRQIRRVSWLRWSCDEHSYSALALSAEPVYSGRIRLLAAPAPAATGTPSVVGRDIEGTVPP